MQPREFEMPKQRVRPATDQSNRSAHSEARRPTKAHSTTRRERGEWRSPYPLSEGMTGKQIAQTFAVCLVAVLVGHSLLNIFAWCVGHFMKGWW